MAHLPPRVPHGTQLMFETYSREEIETIKKAALESSKPITDNRAYQILKKLEFFNNVSEVTLYEVVKDIKLKKYDKHAIIIKEGELDDTIFLVVKGAVAIYKNRKYEKERLIGVLKENDVFGEIGFLLNQPRNATAKVSLDESLILTFRLDRSKMEMGSNPKETLIIYKNIAANLAVKLEALNKRFCI